MTESQMKLHRFMGSKRAKNLPIEHKEVLIKLWSSKITQAGDTYMQQGRSKFNRSISCMPT